MAVACHCPELLELLHSKRCGSRYVFEGHIHHCCLGIGHSGNLGHQAHCNQPACMAWSNEPGAASILVGWTDLTQSVTEHLGAVLWALPNETARA